MLEEETLKILETKISQLQVEIGHLVKDDPTNFRLKNVLELSEELDQLIMNYLNKARGN